MMFMMGKQISKVEKIVSKKEEGFSINRLVYVLVSDNFG